MISSSLTLALTLVAGIQSQERSVDVFAFAQVFDDPVILEDGVSSTSSGLFEEDIDLTAVAGPSAVNGRAEQSSEIETGYFDANGFVVGSIYIQGVAEVEADSLFRMTLEVVSTGRVSFDGICLTVDNEFGGDEAHDRPGDATVSVSITESDADDPIFELGLALDDEGTFEEILVEDPLHVLLPAGTWDVVVRATVTDSTENDINEVEFGLAAATYDVTGSVRTCVADIDGDQVVGVNDLVELILAWGGADDAADLNGDGAVDVTDLVLLLQAWGSCLGD